MTVGQMGGLMEIDLTFICDEPGCLWCLGEKAIAAVQEASS